MSVSCDICTLLGIRTRPYIINCICSNDSNATYFCHWWDLTDEWKWINVIGPYNSHHGLWKATGKSSLSQGGRWIKAYQLIIICLRGVLQCFSHADEEFWPFKIVGLFCLWKYGYAPCEAPIYCWLHVLTAQFAGRLQHCDTVPPPSVTPSVPLSASQSLSPRSVTVYIHVQHTVGINTHSQPHPDKLL